MAIRHVFFSQAHDGLAVHTEMRMRGDRRVSVSVAHGRNRDNLYTLSHKSPTELHEHKQVASGNIEHAYKRAGGTRSESDPRACSVALPTRHCQGLHKRWLRIETKGIAKGDHSL